MLIAIAPYSTEQTNGNICSEWQERIGRWHIAVQESATAWATRRFHGAGAKLAVTYFLTSMAPNQCVLAEGGLLFRSDAAATDAAPACPAGSFTPCHAPSLIWPGAFSKIPAPVKLVATPHHYLLDRMLSIATCGKQSQNPRGLWLQRFRIKFAYDYARVSQMNDHTR